jgi:hypothetical protein
VTEHSDSDPAADGVPDNPYVRLVARIEGARSLDGAVEAIAPVAGHLAPNKSMRGYFNGSATGIPPHVILTDVPMGAWFMAQYLDFFGDEASRIAARRLIGLGLLSAAPTALTGWGRWLGTPRKARRVGVVHAVSNGVAILTYFGSWVARTSGHERLGVTLARAGSVPLIVGGFLGGNIARRSARLS